MPTAAAMLPKWAADLTALYEADAINQFLIYGNVDDRYLLPSGRLGSLSDLLSEALLSPFDIVLSYDLGGGIRIERGGAIFAKWPSARNEQELPKRPREAFDFLTHFFRYCANLARVGQGRLQVACIVRDLELIAPAGPLDHESGALVSLIRSWSSESLLTSHPFLSILTAGNWNDVHPMLSRNTRCAQVEIPFPSSDDMMAAFAALQGRYSNVEPDVARAMTGSTLAAAERELKLRHHLGQKLRDADLVEIKKRNVEAECRGLIEFVQSSATLENVQGLTAVKQWLRQDIALWRSGEIGAVPKGYLLCGPVGTGKSYLVECLAGEAGVPVVKLKNFRDRWVGSTEGNLERIFRMLRALGRCYVFIDEADQSLGRRDVGGDSGVSGRIYSMLAEEMGSSRSRGRVIWILASSRPDLIEVDFKRPGRVDVKIPLLPAETREESYRLIRSACNIRGLDLDEPPECEAPLLLTPGAAEAIAVKMLRAVKTTACTPAEALRQVLADYVPPVPEEVIRHQMALAIAECTEPSFIPPAYR